MDDLFGTLGRFSARTCVLATLCLLASSAELRAAEPAKKTDTPQAAAPKSAPAPEAMPEPAPAEEVSSLGYEWFDPEQKRVEIQWPVASEWVESNDGQILRTWVQAQGSYVLDQGKETGVKIEVNPPGSPFNPKEGPSYSVDLLPDVGEGIVIFRLAKNRKQTLTLHIRVSDVKVADKPLFQVGLGFEGGSYSEDPIGVSQMQLGWTLLAEYSRPIKTKFEFGANARVTALPFGVGASTVPVARFFNAGVRGGYKLPKAYQDLKWTVGLGFHAWGMLVPTNAYGGTTFGPQLIVIARTPQNSSKPKVYDVRFSYMGGGIDVRATYEWGVPLFGAKKSWSAFVTAGFTNFESTEEGNSLTLVQGIIGLKTQLGGSKAKDEKSDDAGTAAPKK